MINNIFWWNHSELLVVLLWKINISKKKDLEQFYDFVTIVNFNHEMFNLKHKKERKLFWAGSSKLYKYLVFCWVQPKTREVMCSFFTKFNSSKVQLYLACGRHLVHGAQIPRCAGAPKGGALIQEALTWLKSRNLLSWEWALGHPRWQLTKPLNWSTQFTKPLKLRTQIAKPFKLFPWSIKTHDLSDQITKPIKPSTSIDRVPRSHQSPPNLVCLHLTKPFDNT